jgi:hypothetical protein
MAPTFAHRCGHPITSTRIGRRARGLLCVGALGLSALIVGGCKSTLGYQGKSGVDGSPGRVLATYSIPTLKTELPPDVAVESIAAAATAVLEARGYTIERSDVSSDRATISAKMPGDGELSRGLDRTVVRSRITGAGTGLTVTVEPWGEEMISRALLDAILARLGR